MEKDQNKNISWMELKGLPFYYLESTLETGTDTTVLFLHGFPDDATTWQKQIDHFKTKAHIYAPYTWGTYKGWKYKPKHYALSFQVEALEEFVRQKKIQPHKLVIVGHDLGGPIAYELAQLIGPIKKLVMINSLSYGQFLSRFKDIKQMLKSSYMLLFQNPLINKTTMKPIHKLLLGKAYDMGGLEQDDPLRGSGPEVLTGIEQYRQFTRELPRRILKKASKQSSPTLILWGKDDPFLTPPTNSELCEYYESFEYYNIKAKHWVHRTNADEVNQYLEDVIKEEDL